MWPLSRKASIIRRRSSTSGSARNVLSLEVLEDRRVMAALAGSLAGKTALTVRLDPVTAWIDQNIQDAPLRSLVKQLDADRVLSRTDMMAIFNQAALVGGVTPTEFNDLQDVVSRPDLLGTPEYVQNLANKVVNGDRANADFGDAPLGNLAPGSPGAKLTTLVSKWFRGGDHPDLPSVSDLGLAPGETLTYLAVSGSLFGAGGPLYTDVDQGVLGDCSLMASLAETAVKSPSTIQNMFIDNGDGTYTVRFFRGGTSDYVTVDRYLPVASTDILVFANVGDLYYSTSNVLWDALAEKAFAQFNESGFGAASGDSNDYEAIDDLWPIGPLSQVSGRDAYSFGMHDGAATVMGAFIGADFLSGDLVLFTSKYDAPAWNVVDNHVYAMIGYDAVTRQFKLANPWGPDAKINNQPANEITLSTNALFNNFRSFTITNPGYGVTAIDTILHTQQIPPLYDAYITDIISSIIICGPIELRHLTATSYLNSIQGLAGVRTATSALGGRDAPRRRPGIRRGGVMGHISKLSAARGESIGPRDRRIQGRRSGGVRRSIAAGPPCLTVAIALHAWGVSNGSVVDVPPR